MSTQDRRGPGRAVWSGVRPSSPGHDTWHPATNVAIERRIWHVVLQHHMDYGIVPHRQQYLDQLAAVITTYRPDRIEAKERRTRHDLKARLEETIELAGIPEVLHLGMTSADVVENAYLIRMADTCREVERQTGRPTGWESWLPLRGIKGPVGTQQDQLDLYREPQLVADLDQRLAHAFGFQQVATAVPQTMWRSTDLAWATVLLAHTAHRLDRAQHMLASGYITMVSSYSGGTWNEGDVSSSVVRRVALPRLAEIYTHRSNR